MKQGVDSNNMHTHSNTYACVYEHTHTHTQTRSTPTMSNIFPSQRECVFISEESNRPHHRETHTHAHGSMTLTVTTPPSDCMSLCLSSSDDKVNHSTQISVASLVVFLSCHAPGEFHAAAGVAIICHAVRLIVLLML